MELLVSSYADPVVRKLIDELQQEYVVRYGGPDETPVDPAEFAAPLGHFVIGRVGGDPVACGGWRAHDASEPGFLNGDAEVKRMYVVPRARNRGLARELLAGLETAARAAGRGRMVLETGIAQPEAMALYASSGYEEIEKFGFYRCSESSRCYGKTL
ncbi:GNAT family N-acetyltransferase [Spirillospora sp. NPDC052269]